MNKRQKTKKIFWQLILPLLVLIIGSTFSSAKAAWYSNSWTKRIKITIDDAKINGSVANFPVYVSLNGMPASFFDNCLANGADLRVTKSDGTTEVAREVVWVNKTLNAGELHFVANGTLTNSGNADFYLYYKNPSASEPSASDTYGKNNVWVNNYIGIWHLQENPAASAPQMTNSKSTSYNGTSYGTMTSTDSINGKMAKALDFDGSDDYIDLGDINEMDGVSKLTLSGWYKRRASNAAVLISKGSGNNVTEFEPWVSSNAVYVVLSSGASLSYGSYTSNDTNWHHFAMIFNGNLGSNSTRLVHYEDGTAKTLTFTLTIPATTSSTTSSLLIGKSLFASAFTNGFSDEIRLSSIARDGNWIKTEYNNQSAPSTFYRVSAAENGGGATPADWLGGGGWTKRIKISVNASQINGTVANFPVYVNLNGMPASFTDNSLTNGADLRVTKSDGITQVAREVVFLNRTSNAGELHFVANGTLSNASNGVFYIYYGNGSGTEPAANATYGKNNVWVNGYAGVWHMQEAVNNNAGGYTDSTSYANNATGVSMALTAVTGKLSGKAQDLDGTADYIYASNSASLQDVMESNFTLSAWHYPDEVPLNDPWYNSFDALICKEGAHSVLMYEYNAFYQITTQAGTSYDSNTSPTTYAINTWHHAVYALATSGTTQTLYVDGVNKASASYSGGLRDFGTNPFKFGVCGTPGNDWDWLMNGKLDEIRISNTNRNGSWIKTEYNNQSSPSTFYSIASPSTISTVAVTTTYPADGATGVPVSSNLVITFDRKIDIQTGNIYIKKSADNSTAETIDVTGGLVSGNGTNQITINPSLNFASNNGYYLQIDATAFDDTGGNSYAGISDTTTWNFTSVLVVPSDWLAVGWPKRIRLSINASQVNGSVSNFPVYVNLNHLPSTFFDDVLANGADLRVTKSDGITQVAREVVFLDKSTNAGELHFVANGTLSNSANGIYYLYYNNGTAAEPSASSTYGKNNVWVNNYAGVWHMQEAVNNTGGGYTDSTSNSNNATGISMALTAVTGKLSGKAQDLDGTADFIYTPDTASLRDIMESNFTLSAWHYPDEVPNNSPWYNAFDGVICREGQHAGILYEYQSFYQISVWAGGGSSYDATSTPTTFADNTWHYAADVVSTSNTTESLFVDGAQRGSASYSGTLKDYSTTPFKFGLCGVAGNDFDWILNGKLDEIRISSTNRNNSWLKTEYNNQSSPSTFYSAASRATSITPFDVLGFYPSDDSANIAGSTSLVIVFDRVVDIQTGNIYIKKLTDGSTVQTIAVTSGAVTGNGTIQVTINPPTDLAPGISYYVQIDATAFDDTVGNSYSGISDSTTWNFTTAATWLNTAWSKRLKIVVDDTKVNGAVLNFPVYVNLNHLSSSNFFNVAKSDGTDIRITQGDGLTELPYELVSFDSTNNAGELYFRAPHMSNSANSDFYLYYGNSNAHPYNAGHQLGSYAVWSNGYVAVYHMAQDPNGDVTNVMKNSVSNSKHGTPSGSMTTSDLVSCQLGNCLDFDGSNDKISFTATAIANGSVSCWTNAAVATGTDNTQGYLGIVPSTGLMLGHQASSYAGLSMYNSSWYTANGSTTSTSTWYHHTGLFGSGSGVKYYRNGVKGTNNANTTSMPAGTFNIGLYSAGYEFTGKVDEFRLSSKIRDGNWIKTEYNNQNSATTFYRVDSTVGTNGDESNPKLLSTYPANQTTNFPLAANLKMNFNKTVSVNSGNIYIYRANGNSLLETISIGSGNVTGSGTSSITINPSSNLPRSRTIYVLMDGSALLDASSNAFPGLGNPYAWRFSTEGGKNDPYTIYQMPSGL